MNWTVKCLMLDGVVGGQVPHKLRGLWEAENNFFFLESSAFYADLSENEMGANSFFHEKYLS